MNGLTFEDKRDPVSSISIITINYNNKVGLEHTIASVLSQDTKIFEYLIIDGGSTDGSTDIIKNNNKHITYWVSEKDTGIYNAVNKGIIKASGSHIIFLNSGDLFLNGQVISNCYKYIHEFGEVDIFYSDIFVNGKNNEKGFFLSHPKVLNLKFFKNSTINHQASVIKRDLFNDFGLYPEHYKLASDYWLYIFALLRNKIYKHLDFCMVIYDITGVSSADNFKQYKIEQKQIWNFLVPKYAKQFIEENEKLESDNASYQRLVNYKIVKAAIYVNTKFQKFRGIV